jgi:hypothetical protein
MFWSSAASTLRDTALGVPCHLALRAAVTRSPGDGFLKHALAVLEAEYQKS